MSAKKGDEADDLETVLRRYLPRKQAKKMTESSTRLPATEGYGNIKSLLRQILMNPPSILAQVNNCPLHLLTIDVYQTQTVYRRSRIFSNRQNDYGQPQVGRWGTRMPSIGLDKLVLVLYGLTANKWGIIPINAKDHDTPRLNIKRPVSVSLISKMHYH